MDKHRAMATEVAEVAAAVDLVIVVMVVVVVVAGEGAGEGAGEEDVLVGENAQRAKKEMSGVCML